MPLHDFKGLCDILGSQFNKIGKSNGFNFTDDQNQIFQRRFRYDSIELSSPAILSFFYNFKLPVCNDNNRETKLYLYFCFCAQSNVWQGITSILEVNVLSNHFKHWLSTNCASCQIMILCTLFWINLPCRATKRSEI
jgi:hypothetical protein